MKYFELPSINSTCFQYRCQALIHLCEIAIPHFCPIHLHLGGTGTANEFHCTGWEWDTD
jgi:hypothetical protein